MSSFILRALFALALTTSLSCSDSPPPPTQLSPLAKAARLPFFGGTVTVIIFPVTDLRPEWECSIFNDTKLSTLLNYNRGVNPLSCTADIVGLKFPLSFQLEQGEHNILSTADDEPKKAEECLKIMTGLISTCDIF